MYLRPWQFGNQGRLKKILIWLLSQQISVKHCLPTIAVLEILLHYDLAPPTSYAYMHCFSPSHLLYTSAFTYCFSPSHFSIIHIGSVSPASHLCIIHITSAPPTIASLARVGQTWWKSYYHTTAEEVQQEAGPCHCRGGPTGSRTMPLQRRSDRKPDWV